MATLAEHLALYDALRASILARHLALGRHHRANLLSLTNRLEPLSPALAARPPAEREVLRRWNVAEHERETVRVARPRCAVSAATAWRPSGIVLTAFSVFGGWNVPSNTDSRTASVPPSRSKADHRSASTSPMRNPVAAMSVTIVRCGSSSSLSSFARLSPLMMAGFSFSPFCGNVTPRAGFDWRYPYSTAVSRMLDKSTQALRTTCHPAC